MSRLLLNKFDISKSRFLNYKWGWRAGALAMFTTGLWLGQRNSFKISLDSNQSKEFKNAAEKNSSKQEVLNKSTKPTNDVGKEVDPIEPSVIVFDLDKISNSLKSLLDEQFAKPIRQIEAATDQLNKLVEENLDGRWISDFSSELENYAKTVVEPFVKDLQPEQILGRSERIDLHPELERDANVRYGDDLNESEKKFKELRKVHIHRAFADFIGVDAKEVDPRDIPVIGFAGSGGGYRAMISTLGCLSGAKQIGLWDCFTYTAGVSGSCWLLNQYYTVGEANFDKLKDHMKLRLDKAPADLGRVLQIIKSPLASQPLLSGLVRRHSQAPISTVDIFGALLTGTFLATDKSGSPVIDWDYLKISNQKRHFENGDEPMPIYTAVRHDLSSEAEHSYHGFQWFEVTPFEVGTGEFGLYVPTWAFGRKFQYGKSLERLSELETGVYLAIFGSAFCATTAHIIEEIRSNLPPPLTKWYQGLAEQHHDQLLSLHPITPAIFNNPFYQCDLRKVPRLNNQLKNLDEEAEIIKPNSSDTGLDVNHMNKDATSLTESKNLSLMDAGIDNNLPIYPLLKLERKVEIIFILDSSQNIKARKALLKADEYTQRQGFSNWPKGLDPWNGEDTSIFISPSTQANEKSSFSTDSPQDTPTLEDTTNSPVTVIYLPLQADSKNPDGLDPATSLFCSTWNFSYSADQVEQLSSLSKQLITRNQDIIKRTLYQAWKQKQTDRLAKEASRLPEEMLLQIAS